MKVLVCGSRHFNDEVQMAAVLSKYEITELIHGGARGADTLSGAYSKRRGISTIVFPADWNACGKAAGPIRNIQMLVEGKPDHVIAFLAPNSRGTKHMISIAQKAGIPVTIVNIGVE